MISDIIRCITIPQSSGSTTTITATERQSDLDGLSPPISRPQRCWFVNQIALMPKTLPAWCNDCRQLSLFHDAEGIDAILRGDVDPVEASTI